MEIVFQQSCVEYQRPSLIEFLLGDHRTIGWLEAYAGQSRSPSADTLIDVAIERHAAAA